MRPFTSLGLLFSLCAITGCSMSGSKPEAPGEPELGSGSLAPPAPSGTGTGHGSAPSTTSPGSGAQDAGAAADAGGPVGGGSAPSPAAGQAMVRIVHASPDAPAVDIYVEGNSSPIVTGISYGQTSTWIQVQPGTIQVDIRASPSTATDPLVYTTGPLTIPDQADVTAVAAGLLSSQDADASFRVLPLVNAYAPAPPMTARVRVLHAGADAPTVDLDPGNQDPTSPAFPGLARFQDTGAAGLSFPADQPVDVGIDVGGERVTAFTTPTLADGADILVIATGLLASLPRQASGFALLVVGPNGNLGFIEQDPLVYALHVSPDAPEIDAFVGDAKLVDGLSFGGLTAPMQVQPGTYQIDIFPHTSGSARPGGAPVLSQPVGPLAAGQTYVAIASGFLTPPNGTQPLQLDAVQEDFDLGDTNSRLRAVHESPDAPAVDIGVASTGAIAPVLFPDLVFGTSSDASGLSATPGDIPVGVTPAGADSTIVAEFSIPAASGQRAFVIAEGALSPEKGQEAFRLGVLDTTASPWTITHVFPQ